MFADLNKYAIRPSSSIGVLYDHRDYFGAISKRLAFETPVFKGLVEMEKTSLSKRSRKLFTLSAIYSATKALFKDIEAKDKNESTLYTVAADFWSEVGLQIAEWRMVQQNSIAASEVRQDYIHSHGITLHALGHVGNALLRDQIPFKEGLAGLVGIDWHRSNRDAWEGRAMHSGKLSKASTNVVLTAIQIKKHLSIPLTSEEELTEREFLQA
jgi:DNA sulfur modification protein DndB